MKFIDFFAGIGGFRRGMELAGHECVGFCEFDKFAVASYTSMHLITDTQRETLAGMPIKQRQKEILKDEYRNGEWYANDIRSVRADEIPSADCWCFGFPCQDISIAGKQEGFNGHRSSLFFAVTRLVRDLEEEDRPKYLFIENVKNLLSINRGGDFLKLLIELDEIGYDAEWQLLNSKDFGVPQNRERVFIIGHLRRFGPRKILPVTGADGENRICQIGMRQSDRKNPNAYRVYDKDGISPALGTMQGGGREPSISLPFFCDMDKGAGLKCGIGIIDPQGRSNKQISPKDICPTLRSETHGNVPEVVLNIKEATKKEYDEAHIGDSINFAVPGSKTRRGRVGHQIAQTLDTSCNQGTPIILMGDEPGWTDENNGIYVEMPEEFMVYAIWYKKEKCYIAIRRLTPKECFRLQGWADDYFECAAFVNSDSQLYKQAGNGVTVNVIQAIADKMEGDTNQQTRREVETHESKI